MRFWSAFVENWTAYFLTPCVRYFTKQWRRFEGCTYTVYMSPFITLLLSIPHNRYWCRLTNLIIFAHLRCSLMLISLVMMAQYMLWLWLSIGTHPCAVYWWASLSTCTHSCSPSEVSHAQLCYERSLVYNPQDWWWLLMMYVSRVSRRIVIMTQRRRAGDHKWA